MRTSLFAILALSLLSCTQAQLNVPGPCPAVQVQPNFSLTDYLGEWFEYAKFPVFFEANRKCIQGEYTLQADGNMGVKNSGVNIYTNVRTNTVGYAVPVENAKFKVIFPTSRHTNATSNYWVLDTNYSDFTIVYNCIDLTNGTHNIYGWILARSRTDLSNKFIDKALGVFKKYNIDTNKLEKTIQYPECDLFYNVQ